MTTQEYIAKAQEEARWQINNELSVFTPENMCRLDVILDTLIAKTITDYREMVVGKVKKMEKYRGIVTMEGYYLNGKVNGYRQALQDLIDKI